ncbi:MAG: hypothetical protein QOD39_3014, partial [Mycobacterium sp.]|nr:hypothetical protein [Mycobacterium sp.]
MDLESWKRTSVFRHISTVLWIVDPAGVGPRE